MRSLWLVSLLGVQLHALAVTINIDADSLKDASGNPMTSGVIVLVADVKDTPGSNGILTRNGFSGPTAASFSGNDFLVHRWNFSPGAPEYFGPGAFQGAITVSLSGQWQAGDPLRLYWFPQNTAGDTAPGPGKPYGTYRSGSADPAASSSFKWITPAESATLSLNGETASVPKESTISLAFLTTDASTLVTAGSGTLPGTAGTASTRMVVGRFVFYNGSAWDGNDAGANANDDGAIASDKFPLFEGSTGTFANYTSYSRGINGIIVDIQNPANGPGISASDFTFKSGNNNTPTAWTNALAPTSITRRAGAGVGGSERFTIIWADNAIQKQWLQVVVLASANTGLSSPDTFYFGNAIGESGSSASDARIDPTDELLARANPRNVLNPAPIDNAYDFNRDKRVDPTDQLITRANQTSVITALKLISP
jgi:hypothetical protein